MYDYDDFYNEPSEFERQVDEFKQSLIKAVKEEYSEEMERLRKENTELQDVKRRMKEIETEHKQWINQIERNRKQLENTIKQARLNELLIDNFIQGWGVVALYTEMPKCDKCDDKRQLSYTTPRGEQKTEPCECGDKLKSYMPIEVECYEFYQSKSPRGEVSSGINFYFTRVESKDYDEYSKASDIYKNEKFENVRKYNIVFLDKIKCQEYCKWLSEKEQN